MATTIIEVDPFDLPEWLGTDDVVWQADAGLRASHLVPGRLSVTGHEDVTCDLLASDEAYPAPAVTEESRARVHQAWHHGQVLVGTVADRLTLACPGTRIGPEVAVDALGRLARAVGADPERYAVLLRIGAVGPTG